MIRGWLIFSTLVLSVLFNFFRLEGADVTFPLSEYTVTKHWFWYYVFEHLNVILVAICIIIKDSTPRWLLWLFIAIQIADFIHFRLVYRDEGIGFNLAKVIVFGVPMAYLEINTQWKHLKKYMNRE